MGIAKTPKPPYYVVIFTNIQTDNLSDYAETATKMESLAQQQPGYLGIESARDTLGITVSYWRDLQSIKQWKENIEHERAQAMGKAKWYSDYTTRIALVEREYCK